MPTKPRVSQLRKDYHLYCEKPAGVSLDEDALTLRATLESLASQINRILDVTLVGQWYDDIPEVSTKKRSLRQLNEDLHTLETSGVPGHETLDTLTHVLAEDNYTELVYSGDDLISTTVWQTTAKITKIRESTFTYVGALLTGVVTVQFDSDGNPLTTLTKSLTYDGSDNLQNVTTVKT